MTSAEVGRNKVQSITKVDFGSAFQFYPVSLSKSQQLRWTREAQGTIQHAFQCNWTGRSLRRASCCGAGNDPLVLQAVLHAVPHVVLHVLHVGGCLSLGGVCRVHFTVSMYETTAAPGRCSGYVFMAMWWCLRVFHTALTRSPALAGRHRAAVLCGGSAQQLRCRASRAAA